MSAFGRSKYIPGGVFGVSVRIRRWRPVAPEEFGNTRVDWCRRGDPQSPEEGLGVG